jgi:hypothetical protein
MGAQHRRDAGAPLVDLGLIRFSKPSILSFEIDPIKATPAQEISGVYRKENVNVPLYDTGARKIPGILSGIDRIFVS